jgi:Tfp pilus assembly protein FimT
MTPPTQTRHRGFTVVEMVLSMAVMTVLLGGIASALVIAARAVPGTATPMSLTVAGYYAAERLASELYAAQTITARSATSVTFTVADRNADSNPETILYSWSGVAGQPLNRQYNGGAAGAVLDSVYQFNLGYVTQVISGANKVTVVNITIQAGSDAAARVDTSVQLLNQPS